MSGHGRRQVWLVVLVLAGTLAVTSGAVLAGDDTSRTTVKVTPQLASVQAGGGQAATESKPGTHRSNSIDVTHEYRLTPGEPGRIDVQWRFDIPDSVAKLNTTLPATARDPRLNGFERRDGRLVWREAQQSTHTPTATFALPVNETTDGGSPKYVDTGEWALIKQPPVANVSFLYYTNQGRPSVTRTNVTAGEGVAADAMVYLGEHETVTRRAHGQQFRLVIPAAATLTEEASDVFDAVTAASGALRVGDRDETVTMIAAPASVPWGVAGLQRGDGAFYTIANQSVDDPNNTWVHEYVHTRQEFEPTDATRWFVEASAEYYAAQLSLQQGRIDFGAFSESLGVGAERRFGDVVLSTPDSWHDAANYDKGGLVAGELDRRIRATTGGSASLQTVFGWLNDGNTPVGQRTFVGAVEAAGGNSVAETARRFTETTDGPEMWTRQQHGDAFGSRPAQFAYTFPTDTGTGLRIRGPYRNGTLGAAGLVTGERLVADVTVENVGGTAGTYDLTITRNGVAVADRTGTAAAGEQVTETVPLRFPNAGTYRLSTGTDSLDVRVDQPATPTVTGITVNRTTVPTGGGVRVRAVVTNQNDRPATGEVTVRRDATPLVGQQLSIDIGESTELLATTTVTESGTAVFSAGTRSVEVAVGDVATATPGRATAGDGNGSDGGDGTAGASGTGFGPVGVLVAVAVLLVVGRRIE